MDPRGRADVPRRTGAYTGPSARQIRFRRSVLAVTLLSLVALVAGCLGRSGPAPVPLDLAWAFSPASNTVTIRLTSSAGAADRQILAQSRLAVSENGGGRWSAGARAGCS